MRVTIFDRNPGPGFGQWFLKTCWLVGCWLQKLLGLVDDYYGAATWDEALHWLAERPDKLTSIQYWGHGSTGQVWMGDTALWWPTLLPIKPKLAPDAVIWFRCCWVFRGDVGHAFAKSIVAGMNCTVASHTFVIGLLQPGLHTLRPGQEPSWPISEGCDLKAPWWPDYLRPWLPHTIFCLTTRIPEGW